MCDERLLDLGCGRGAVLIAAAARLPAGRADRVELHTAGMTGLPFPDHSFDVVTSALAIHNIPRSTSE